MSACWLCISVFYVSVFLCASVSVSQSVCSRLLCQYQSVSILAKRVYDLVSVYPHVCKFQCLRILVSVHVSVTVCCSACVNQCLYVPVFVYSKVSMLQCVYVFWCLVCLSVCTPVSVCLSLCIPVSMCSNSCVPLSVCCSVSKFQCSCVPQKLYPSVSISQCLCVPVFVGLSVCY